VTNKKILVVDDEPGITRLLKLNLELTGRYTVQEENRGSHALSAARKFKPDLVLLDVMMPDLDGGDVAAALMEEHGLKATRIVFLTAAVKPQEVKHPIGGFRYLAKPLDMKELLDVLDTELGQPA
jgi:CheY-like chemotaxis protein